MDDNDYEVYKHSPLYPEYKAFCRLNRSVVDEVTTRTVEELKNGKTHGAIAKIIEDIRAEGGIGGVGAQFDIPNAHRAFFARECNRVIEKHYGIKRFFTTRRLRSLPGGGPRDRYGRYLEDVEAERDERKTVVPFPKKRENGR